MKSNKFGFLFMSFIMAVSFLTTACDQEERDPNYWAKNYTISEANFHYGRTGAATTDGGYLAAGSMQRKEDHVVDMSDIFVIKTNSEGNTVWQKEFRGQGMEMVSDYEMTIIETDDGGYAFTAITNSWGVVDENGIAQHVWVVKLDSAGFVEWEKAYGSESHWSGGKDLIRTSDGGFLVTGYPLIKLSSTGAVEWQKALMANSVIEAADGYVVAGKTGDNEDKIGYWDGFVLKVGLDGSALWKKQYGKAERFTVLNAIITDGNGGYLAAGAHSYWNGSRSVSDVLVIKLDASGNASWNKLYDSGNDGDVAYAVTAAGDGNYLVGGEAGSDGWAIKMSASGSVVWQKSCQEAISGIYEVQESSVGYLLAGTNGGTRPALLSIRADGHIPGANFSVTNTSASGSSASLTTMDSTAALSDTAVVVTDTSATIYDLSVSSSQY
ncbi:MAG: hypothetical protein GY754_29065 [bacterium]|nr:hypothetical protein [bacterium]